MEHRDRHNLSITYLLETMLTWCILSCDKACLFKDFDLGAEKSLVEKLEQHGVHSLRSLEDVETHIRESDAILEKKRNSERTRILNEILALSMVHISM